MNKANRRFRCDVWLSKFDNHPGLAADSQDENGLQLECSHPFKDGVASQ